MARAVGTQSRDDTETAVAGRDLLEKTGLKLDIEGMEELEQVVRKVMSILGQESGMPGMGAAWPGRLEPWGSRKRREPVTTLS